MFSEVCYCEIMGNEFEFEFIVLLHLMLGLKNEVLCGEAKIGYGSCVLTYASVWSHLKYKGEVRGGEIPPFPLLPSSKAPVP